MKRLRRIVDYIKPSFEKGGRFETLHSFFDAVETFLFVPNRVTKSGAHIRDAIDMKRTMFTVVIALIPALLYGMWNVGHWHYLAVGEAAQKTFWETFGYGCLKVLPIVIVSYVTGLTIEIIFAQIRHHEVPEGFFVTGMLIPLILPPDIPLWMVVVATTFAVIIGVEVFGGSGMNLLNPALTARAFLFFAYPSEMSGDKVWVSGLKAGHGIIDGFTSATPLTNLTQGHSNLLPPVRDMFFGFMPGSIGETSKIAILLGAAILIYTGIGSWKIMFSGVVGALAMGYLMNVLSPLAHTQSVIEYMAIAPYKHLLMGGFAFGIIFMATDPVSAAQTNKGKWIYGFLIGVLVILIRVFNPAYPEGTMLAILLMNVMAPLIDYYVVQTNVKHRMKRVKVSADEINS
jgi:Na+-transporting NADH:ubiquinone oxidoreductase subunit B